MKKIIFALLISLGLNSFAFELTNNFDDEGGCFCTALTETLKTNKIYKNYDEARRHPSERLLNSCSCGIRQIGINNQNYQLEIDYDRRKLMTEKEKKLNSAGNFSLLIDSEKKVRVKLIGGEVLKYEYSELLDKRVESIQRYTAEIEFNNEKKIIKGIRYYFID